MVRGLFGSTSIPRNLCRVTVTLQVHIFGALTNQEWRFERPAARALRRQRLALCRLAVFLRRARELFLDYVRWLLTAVDSLFAIGGMVDYDAMVLRVSGAPLLAA